jgi:hypothetical protein
MELLTISRCRFACSGRVLREQDAARSGTSQADAPTLGQILSNRGPPAKYSGSPVWSKISNALKRLGFRSHNFLAQLLSETSTACAKAHSQHPY